MPNTAYEMIVSRMPVVAGEALAKYDAVEVSATGQAVKATGAGQFLGIVEYGVDKAGNMATTVKGAYPGVASAPVTAGTKVTVDAGKFKPAAAGNVVYGTALTDAAAIGDTFTVLMSDIVTPAPQA